METSAFCRTSVMESPARHCAISILYLTFIFSILYLLQTLVFSKLIVGIQSVTVKKSATLPLRFRADGTFKILQVADMHYANGVMTRCRDVLTSDFKYCSDLNTTRFVRRMIDAEKPDFLAFTGDNIFGPSTSDAAESLFGAFGPATESGLPWAAVLEGQPVTDIDGFGNYNLRVLGAPGSHLANSSVLNLFFLDSGDRAVVEGIRTYGWIKESQLHWLQGISQGFQMSLCPQPAPPALAFFHIPIPEIRQLYNQKVVGQFQEAVACSVVNSGVFQTFLSMGDVKAAFMGHDHVNDFCGNINGIWFCYGGGFGYHGYGRAQWHRRGRVISLELEKGEKDWLGVERIKTWKRLDDEKLSRIDEQILWVRQ
ncbi:probable inactive purple acid phosphatase 28 isoform X6 [Malania oleifera]|uniref:probable inactive purple acid phosphatase 28 isoform X6 n=1 Tax=Malania oleifera TaxID=397392 RepID=UPI0025ADF2E4|nr:probable inactive purple acid phosphatase 28 isoform X6 [Malania oleifera]